MNMHIRVGLKYGAKQVWGVGLKYGARQVGLVSPKYVASWQVGVVWQKWWR